MKLCGKVRRRQTCGRQGRHGTRAHFFSFLRCAGYPLRGGRACEDKGSQKVAAFAREGRVPLLTIAVTVTVHDGIVLASDSASTLMQTQPNGDQSIVNVHNYANKIFNLYKGLPIGALTFGAGNIGTASISTLAKDLRRRFHGEDAAHKEWHIDPSNYRIADVAERVRKFLVEEHYQIAFAGAAKPPFLGFKVAGYSSGAALSELWEISIADGKCAAATPAVNGGGDPGGITWAGEPEAISRVVLGYGMKLPEVLIGMGVEKEKIGEAIKTINKGLYIQLAAAPMPIQDAIELAQFLVDLTIKFTRFKPGAATVGGMIEVAAITKHEGFKWVSRKHYYDSRLNPEIRHGETEDRTNA
jgi:hypothetical protein